jgi:predicted Holliday junction resolvase-like endonuclease
LKTVQVSKAIDSIITDLNSDLRLVGECSECGESAPLVKWNLFYMDNIPKYAKPQVNELLQEIEQLKADYEKTVEKYTSLAAKKSVEVNIGKIIEEIVPALPTFPYKSADCRSLLDPIDYIVFDGLACDNCVTQIHFLEVKTGQSRLNDHQKQVKSAIENKHVEFQLY